MDERSAPNQMSSVNREGRRELSLGYRFPLFPRRQDILPLFRSQYDSADDKLSLRSPDKSKLNQWHRYIVALTVDQAKPPEATAALRSASVQR